MSYQVCITKPNGDVEEHKLTTSQTTIGSDSGSTIRLSNVPGLVAQHIVLVPGNERCWVGTVPEGPLIDEQGSAVCGEYVPWGATLALGNCLFELRTSGKDMRKQGQASGSNRTSISPFYIVLALMAIGYLMLPLLTSTQSSSASVPSNQPALFDPPLPCTEGNVIHRAEASEEAAFAKSQRLVFDLQDGVEAVVLFEESKSCYLSGGLEERASEVGKKADALRASLEEEYRFLRLRLQRSLREGATDIAMRQLSRLSALLRHRSQHPYVLALRRLRTRLSVSEQSHAN